MVMNMAQTKNDMAWKKLFEKYDILKEIEKNNVFHISSSQINEFREARLMTKFDNSDNLPKIFKENSLAILPDSRGTYIIGRFKAYQNLQVKDMKPIPMKLPNYIQSVDVDNITSEAVALNVAYASGMIDYIIGNDTAKDGPSYLTISGRLGSGDIDFRIRTKGPKRVNDFFHVHVQNSQIEIDGSYETKDAIALIEAKNKLPKDFLIRQLYYPYRYYKNLAIDKKVIPIFFTYADDIFNFYIYQFENSEEYTSIKKVSQYSFILNRSLDIELEDVIVLAKNSPMIKETEELKFPQANNFLRILDMLDYLEEPKSKEDLAKEYEFNERQSDYYANALIYLGLAKKDQQAKFVLNEEGNYIKSLGNTNERNTIIMEKILSKKIFALAFERYLEKNKHFDRKYVVELILKYVPTVNSLDTAKRRSSTVKAWLDWMFSMIESDK